MTPKTTLSPYLQGMADGAPFVLVVVPFGLLFGVVAAEAGLHVLESLTLSLMVVAGASQFTAVQLLSEGAPTFIALFAALAVNLRMAMYAAALAPHWQGAPLRQRAFAAWLVQDQGYACAMIAYDKNPQWSASEKLRYYVGTASLICPIWGIFTVVGALVGAAIPPEYALDFAVPITFLAMLAPMLRTGPHMAAALVAVTVSLLLAGLPYSLGLLIAGALGMITGAQVETIAIRKGASV
ncbi:AzlC family ABC transporter permease [Rhodobacteraceae bacterium KMM 6894]|nr:AzlC family ABC transporter permease [Rhodobacteraceae bacterium KMM 6894]